MRLQARGPRKKQKQNKNNSDLQPQVSSLATRAAPRGCQQSQSGQAGQHEAARLGSHHLKLAGRADTLFSDDALALIHQVSRGLPRAVNNLAVQSLVAAFAGAS